MNKKVTLKDIAIMQSGIYMKTDSQGEVRYLQVKDVNSENKLDYTQEKAVERVKIRYHIMGQKEKHLCYFLLNTGNICFV